MSNLEPDWYLAELRRFEESLVGKTASQIMIEYRSVAERLISEARNTYIQGSALACHAGCSACCHQPIAIQLVELCDLYFKHEDLFSSKSFQKKLTAHLKTLNRLRKLSATMGLGLAETQWQLRQPCLLLDAKAMCMVYEDRPLLCRNLFAKKVCTFDSYQGVGSELIGKLGKDLRRLIFQHLRLARFSTPALDLERHYFILAEGFVWMREANLGALRKIFVREV